MVDTCPELLNIFVNEVRRYWQALGLFDKGHCTGEYEGFEGKVLVLNPTVRKDEYKTPDFQLFLAESRFGCSPQPVAARFMGNSSMLGSKPST